MTREESIELLVNATYSDEWQGNEQLTKANLMEIEALEQEPRVEEQSSSDPAKILYLCDRRRCDNCFENCRLTSDIKHAENFIKNNNVFEEREKPLIHCKDCIHRYATGDVTKYYVCDFMDAQYEDNGYCHHGERKEE